MLTVLGSSKGCVNKMDIFVICGAVLVLACAIGVIGCLALCRVGSRTPPAPLPKCGPRLPCHRNNVRPIHPLPEWQEHERDVDHLERVAQSARDEAFWLVCSPTERLGGVFLH